MLYELIELDKLKPLELVFPTHLENLERMIDRDGFMLKAILADRKTGTILDGSHRYIYLLKKGFKLAPVHWVDYFDENVRVGTKLRHRFLMDEEPELTKSICVEHAITGNLLPPRTTRHFFPFRKSDISVPLEDLIQGKPRNAEHLIAKVNISEEIAHNNKYLKEIDTEISTIISYLAEVEETKKYLISQVETMQQRQETAFFPGKFHPPHIGHILTMLSLLPKYKKLIIGVSEDVPEDKVTDPGGIKETLSIFFKDFNNVEVVLISGVLVESENAAHLPKFDVLLSGNNKVLKWAEEHNIKNEYVARSEGYLLSGTEVRHELLDS